MEPNREVEQAVTALTTEILKLSPLEGEAHDALSVTIENAFSRLAIAILAQASSSQDGFPPGQMLDQLPPVLSASN